LSFARKGVEYLAPSSAGECGICSTPLATMLPAPSFSTAHLTPPLTPRLIWCAVLRYLICSA
jgi:hypothetical protein